MMDDIVHAVWLEIWNVTLRIGKKSHCGCSKVFHLPLAFSCPSWQAEQVGSKGQQRQAAKEDQNSQRFFGFPRHCQHDTQKRAEHRQQDGGCVESDCIFLECRETQLLAVLRWLD